jgi:hypothetical protein
VRKTVNVAGNKTWKKKVKYGEMKERGSKKCEMSAQ